MIFLLLATSFAMQQMPEDILELVKPFIPSAITAHISETKSRFIATTGLHSEPGTVNTFTLPANHELRIPVSSFHDRVLYLRFRNPENNAQNCNISIGGNTCEF